MELGVGIIENLEAAVRYGGSTDGATSLAAGDYFFLPESEYGAVVNWGVFDSTNLAVECLRAQFEDNAEIKTDDTVTVQLAVEF